MATAVAGTGTPSEPTDPRIARSRRVIIEAAAELLVERGFAGTTVEAIAARSGAAKTTIYRHWPHKAAVLRTAIESLAPMASAPDTGSLRGDLTCFTEELAEIMDTPPTLAVITGLVDAAERDAGLARLLADLTANRREPVRVAVTRAIDRGEVDPHMDPDLVVGLVVGPFFYRRAFSREPLDAAFLRWLVDAVMVVVAPRRE